MDNLSKEAIKIFESIKLYEPVRPSELGRLLKLSSKTIQKHLIKLRDEDLIKKIGLHPKIFYVVKTHEEDNYSESKDIFYDTDDL